MQIMIFKDTIEILEGSITFIEDQFVKGARLRGVESTNFMAKLKKIKSSPTN